MTVRRLCCFVALCGPVLLGVACASAREGVKGDTWIADCDTLTQEAARIHIGMPKEEVTRILGIESWVLQGSIGVDDVYHQLVVYNYNADCLKLRGKLPGKGRRQLMIEYANEAVARVVDRAINTKRSRRRIGG